MKSPIKWTGGKRREISFFSSYLPIDYKIYIEPFVGGGAVYWHLLPQNAIINDINPHLINFYQVLRDDHKSLEKILVTYEHNTTFFNKLVNILNKKNYNSKVEQAAIFYYLNKTSFSGKWRVNRSGNYNNTWGNYKKPNYKFLDKQYSENLKNTAITCKDFKEILEDYKNCSDAFIFLDPPYLNCDSMYTAEQDFTEIYKYIHNYMGISQSKVMLIVKGDNLINDLFTDYIKNQYSVNYSHNANSKTVNNHLIITNYS